MLCRIIFAVIITTDIAHGEQHPPSARYSPLAAQGGYRGQRTTWYDAMFHSLNPTNTNWGLRWEQRRAVLIENSVANKYFVFCAVLFLCFYSALLAIA